MTKTIIRKIKKNVAIINIIIFFVAALFFYLNKDKFNTYKAYVEYNFQERLMFTSHYDSSIFYAGKIEYFLNDLDFDKKLYGITDSSLESSTDKINIDVNHNNKKITFTFITKEKKILSSIVFKNNNEEDLAKKNEELINNFIENSLDRFHKKLYKNLNKEISFRRNQLKELINFRTNKLDKASDLANTDTFDIEISNKKKIISELYQFLNQNNELIIVDDYSNKFRRLYLNSDEYVISFLILILTINFLIRYSDKILK
jgi:hypothetical protein